MLLLYLAQAAVPLGLIAWIAFAPPRSHLGFWVQVLATALGVYAVARLGLWLFPPWWTPLALGALLVGAIALGRRRRASQARRRYGRVTLAPTGPATWFALVAFVGLGLFATTETWNALAGSRTPAGAAVRLETPLGPGRYLVANGGASLRLNAHADALDQTVPAHRAFYGTAYGIDLVAIDALGFRADGIMPADPAKYRIFGRPVLAPCAGRVVRAVDGLADLRVPEFDRKNLAGNHVILRCGASEIVLAHFRRGSVRVRPGQAVRVGTPLAQVGNSGGTSEPHLHIHAQRPGTVAAPLSGAPIPNLIEGRFLVRNDLFIVKESR